MYMEGLWVGIEKKNCNGNGLLLRENKGFQRKIGFLDKGEKKEGLERQKKGERRGFGLI